MRIRSGIILSVMIICMEACLAHADNWLQWRGIGSAEVSPEKNLPMTQSEETGIAWRCELPGRGNSTPAIWDDAIFVTCHVGRDLLLLRIEKNEGKIVWQEQVGDASGDNQWWHSESNMASPSPVTDGNIVVAHFGNGDYAGYDYDGKQLWKRNLQQVRFTART